MNRPITIDNPDDLRHLGPLCYPMPSLRLHNTVMVRKSHIAGYVAFAGQNGDDGPNSEILFSGGGTVLVKEYGKDILALLNAEDPE